MDDLAITLSDLGDELARVVDEMFAGDAMRAASDVSVLETMAAAGRVVRLAEAIVLDATAQVIERSEVPGLDNRMTTRFGCRSAGEVVQRATRVSRATASDTVRAAAAIRRAVAPSSGEILPADFPRMREALAAGEVGVDGVLAVAAPFSGSAAGRIAILAADAELAASARGEGADAGPPPCADELRAMATVWAMFLDQDGAEPREARAMRKRGISLGLCRDNLVPIRGNLLPELAAQLQLGFDSLLNPKVDGAPQPSGPAFGSADGEAPRDPWEPVVEQADSRSRAQKQHDALATILTVIAGSGALPRLGGAAPTLVVSVQEKDLIDGRGFAHIGGIDEPVPLSTARHIACSGAVQRVVSGENGRIVSITTFDRVFNHHQRRAIALRDGGCVIPGCHIPAQWCEVHHVQDHSRGGPTHTDNGVLLCWHHHRTLDEGGWMVRVNDGIPEVRGPSWWDTKLRWRAATTSPTRMRERVARRT